MFVLRKITGEDSEMNFELGDAYSLVLKSKSPERFQEMSEPFYVGNNNIYGFIACGVGLQIHALYDTQKNYIMNDNGGLFAHIKKE